MVPVAKRSLAETFPVALVYPQAGPAGMFGTSCAASAAVAARMINRRGGLMGREIELIDVDASVGALPVANHVGGLVRAGAVEAVVGWHTSDVRRALATRIERRVPYIYTALYEGGEHTDGVFLTGETPGVQLRPAMEWMRDNIGIRRWTIVGNRYVWPLDSAMKCRGYARDLGVQIVQQHFRYVGTTDFGDVIRALESGYCDGVIVLLLGEDAVHFNRAFAEAGLQNAMVRMSPLMDENMLLGSGPDATRGLFATAGYFESLNTEGARSFMRDYVDAHGPRACLPTTMGESCVEGLLLLEALVTSARSSDVAAMLANDAPLVFDGPRGTRRVEQAHAQQPIYLAEARNCDFVVIDTL